MEPSWTNYATENKNRFLAFAPHLIVQSTAHKKNKFSIKDFFISSHLLKKPLTGKLHFLGSVQGKTAEMFSRLLGLSQKQNSGLHFDRF